MAVGVEPNSFMMKKRLEQKHLYSSVSHRSETIIGAKRMGVD